MLTLLTLLACQPPPSAPAAPAAPLLDTIELRTAGAGDDAPLIVALHGLGDRPERFGGLLDGFPLPARVLLPAGPLPHGEGFSWFPYPPTDDAQLAQGIAAAADAVAALVAAQEGSGPAVVTGFSQGGMLSYALAAGHSDLIVAAVPVSGTLPAALWPSTVTSPVVVTGLHGDDDGRVPLDGARAAAAALSDRGHDALVVSYPGVGHTISAEMRLDLYRALAAAIGEELPGVRECPLLTPTVAPDRSITLPMSSGSLPMGALLRPVSGRCPEGAAAVEVLSANPLIVTADGVAVGERGCVSRDRLEPLGQRVLIPHPPLPGVDNPFPADTVIDTVRAAPCGSRLYGRLPADALAHLRPATPEMLAAVNSVRAAWPAALGEAPMVGVSEWGHVRLPLPRPLTDAEIAAEQAREGLQTDTQREKATTAEGPLLDGEPLYTHFTGADLRYSDSWGQPGVVSALVALSVSWRAACVAGGGALRACTLQVGDLAWYNDLRPDPLGHDEHYTGLCVDLRLFREDGSRYEAYWNKADDRASVVGGYSATLTEAFLAHALQRAPVEVAYFNDPAVSVPGVVARPGHDDHIHLCLSPP